MLRVVHTLDNGQTPLSKHLRMLLLLSPLNLASCPDPTLSQGVKGLVLFEQFLGVVTAVLTKISSEDLLLMRPSADLCQVSKPQKLLEEYQTLSLMSGIETS